MRSCTEYKASRRPLIDSVRSDLQALLERAAEVDSKVDYVSKPLEMMNSDTKTTTQNELSRDSSPSVHIELGTIETSCSSMNSNRALEKP